MEVFPHYILVTIDDDGYYEIVSVGILYQALLGIKIKLMKEFPNRQYKIYKEA